MPNPTIVSAALNDEELRKSITKLVADYKDSLEQMTDATTTAVDNIKNIIASIGSTKVDFSGTLDGLEKAKKKMTAAASGGGTTTPAKDGYADNTIGALEESIRLEKEKRREMELGSSELRKQNQIIHEQQNQLKEETKSIATKRLENALKMPSNDIDEANKKLRVLEILQRRYGDTTELSVTEQKKLANAIGQTQKAINNLNTKRPRSIKEVLGMDASSIDAIQQKLKAISNLRMNINADAHPRVIQMLNQQYDELHRKQLRLMGQNGDLIRSNRTLASTFGYIRNRIIYAFTLGALASFFRDLRNIRAEYEMLDRSLGILVGDFEKGTQIFNELNQMALQSPFTLIELGTAAKQLTAYNFAADEVVDTTRRLADISAALGVPMERLTYNLGQIKAQGALTARDARDFANAGLAIVPMLADMYTKQKAFGKELTTTADVYDMMSKKMVSYGDVLKVIQQVTDEGGKFFNFQARQADTLKVQIANLSLAYNNMMNDIGASNQGLLSGSIQMVRSLFQNWRTVVNVIEQLIVTFGTYKVVATAVTLINSRMFVGGILVSLRNYIAGIKAATGAMATFNAVTKMNPIGFLAAALATVVGYFLIFKDNVEEASQEVELFGENASKTLKKIDTFKKILDGTSETSSTYKKTLSELSGVMHEYGVELDAEKARRDEVNKATEQTIQLIKEESAERQRANQLEKARETFDTENEAARKNLVETIQKSSNIAGGGVSAEYIKAVRENAEAISAIIEEVVNSNLNFILNKEGEELDAGVERIYTIVNERLTKIGIKGGEIQQILGGFLTTTTAVEKFAKATADANEKLERRTQIINRNHEIAQESIQSTMTFTQKVEANSRALQNNTNDALSLYNKIYDIVKIAQQNHTINFDLKLTADNPPAWMLDKSLPELQRLAQRFAAIAESGGHAEGYTREGTYEQALRYASAARKKQEDEERAARMKNNTKTKKERDAILDAIKEEISLTKKLQGEYDKLTSKGASHADAIKDVQERYDNTIKLLDIDLGKFGLPKFDTNIITGKDPNKQLEYFKNLRDILNSKGMLNLERSKVVDAVIQELDVSAKTYNLDKITKGLNNELGKLKDEYELAVELDANPELGDMFADMFGIDTSTLPQTFGDALDRAQIIINRKLAEMKISTPFDLMQSNVDNFAKSTGLSKESYIIKELVSAQNAYRDIFKKNITETEKVLDDYIKKYGDYSDKIAEIEAGRLEKLKKLNEAYYTEEMRKRPEYIAKLNAIEQGTSKEKQQVDFDEFKNSRYYTMMFENLDYISTKTIRDMRDRVRDLIDTMNDLTPEQLKTLMSQYEKLEQKLVKRSPFKTLTKDLKEYFSTSKERNAANQEFKNAQKEYDVQKKNVAALKEKYEQAKANSNTSQSYLDFLQIEINGENDILEILKKQLDAAQKKADKYNLIAKLAKSEALAVAQVVGQNLQSLGELRDFLQQDLGVELSDELNGLVDGLSKVGQGINKITSSATSGDVVGVITGVGQTVYGLYDGIASIFGGGSASDKKITKQIQDSERAVKRLELAYADLQQAVDRAYGTAVIGAKHATLANKELQLAELQRQIQLEKSRKSKYRDDDKILELEKQYKELFYEIQNGYRELVDDLMGTDVGSFAENLVSSMIDAFKQGEDYMKVFSDKFDEMIDNMIMKSIVSRVVSQYLDQIWDNIDSRINDRSKKERENYKKAQEHLSSISGMSDSEIAGEIAHQRSGNNMLQYFAELSNVTNKDIEEYKKAVLAEESAAKARLDAATEFTGSDVDYIMGQVAEVMPELGQKLKDILGEYYKFGESSETQLSALQQGIQGITEDTAGALEAYMNGVSQQVYYQSDMLTQIRDAVIGFNLDIQVASMSQILLQLQSSYEVQMSIQSILSGWSNASGLAVRVEMV